MGGIGDRRRIFGIPDGEAHRVVSDLLEGGLGGGGWDATRLTLRRAGVGSTTFHARCRGNGREVALKAFRDTRRAVAAFEAAWTAHQRGVGVAAPLLLDAAVGACVTAWVGGETLHARLARPDWEEAVRGAGAWLRRLHGSARPALVRYRPGGVLERPATLRGEVDSGSGRGDAPRDAARDFARGLDRLAAEARALLPGVERSVRLHGDFHFHNVLLTGAGPVGIDMEEVRHGSRHDDLARMLVQLDLLAEAAAPPGFDAGRARAALLEGYRLRGGTARRRLALQEGAELLARWGIALRRGRERPDRVAAVRAVLSRRGWAVAPGDPLPAP